MQISHDVQSTDKMLCLIYCCYSPAAELNTIMQMDGNCKGGPMYWSNCKVLASSVDSIVIGFILQSHSYSFCSKIRCNIRPMGTLCHAIYCATYEQVQLQHPVVDVFFNHEFHTVTAQEVHQCGRPLTSATEFVLCPISIYCIATISMLCYIYFTCALYTLNYM